VKIIYAIAYLRNTMKVC